MANFVDSRGVLYVVFGLRAKDEAEQSIKALKLHCPWPVHVVGDQKPKGATEFIQVDRIDGDPIVSSRAAKTSMYAWSRFESTLYLDADTRPRGDLSFGWTALDRGWDLALAPSWDPSFERLLRDEVGATIIEIGSRYPLPLNSGVIFFRRSDRASHFFKTWMEEWRRWRGRDQGALLRAICRGKPRLLVLGRSWNTYHNKTDALVAHYFGRAEE